MLPASFYAHSLAVPDDNHDISPVPDFDDAQKINQYIKDRRVIGVHVTIPPSRTTLTLSLVRPPRPTRLTTPRNRLQLCLTEDHRVCSLQRRENSCWPR